MNTPLIETEHQRYAQQMNLIEVGEKGQRRLKEATVLVVGAGGLGCAALHYLAAAGIGRLIIVDRDTVELNNLHRQLLYSCDDIGEQKALIAKRTLQKINPHVNVESYNLYLNTENALRFISQAHIVVDATDNYQSRYVINDACASAKKPFVYGSIHHFEGHIALFEHPLDYRYVFPTPPQQTSKCTTEGVIGALPAIIGAMQAMECLKYILQQPGLKGQLLLFNALTWQTKRFNLANSEETINITPSTLHAWYAQGIDILLIDLQEVDERERRHEKALAIPFSSLFEQLTLIPKNKILVFLCSSGTRSTYAAHYLRHYLGNKNAYALISNSH